MFKYRLLITTSIVGIFSMPAIAAETQADETIAPMSTSNTHELFIAKKDDDTVRDINEEDDEDDDDDNIDGDDDNDDDDDDDDDDGMDESDHAQQDRKEGIR